ncbi:21706_t:CDS:1, partial [Racocetra persica]
LVEKTVKCLAKPEWNKRLRKKKLVNTQQHEIDNEAQVMQVDHEYEKDNLLLSTKIRRKRGSSIIDKLKLYNVAKDILSLPASVT